MRSTRTPSRLVVSLLALSLLLCGRAFAQTSESTPTPVKIRVAGKQLALKTPALATEDETFVPLEFLTAISAESKLNARGDAVTVKVRSVSKTEEFALARLNGKPMLALSDLARMLDGVIERPESQDTEGNPIAGQKGDTVYFLARVTEARYENGVLQVKTTFPVPYRVRMLNEMMPKRGYVDCLGATLTDKSTLVPLLEDEKQALRLRAGQNSTDIARVVVEVNDGFAFKHADGPTNVLTTVMARLDPKGATKGVKPPVRVADGNTQKPTPTDGANDITLRNPDDPDSVTNTGNDATQTNAGQTQATTKKPVKKPTTPIEVRQVSFVPQDDQKARLEIATSGKVKPYVRYEHGTTLLVVDVPNALLKLPEEAKTELEFEHPLVSGLRVEMAQEAPPVTRITLDLKRVAGFQANIQNNWITIELRVPRNATGSLAGKLIVVDPGHGGGATGAPGGGYYEKNITLQIGLKLRALLESCGANVIMTRDRDKDVGLYERTKLANDNNADLFLSIHNDSGPRSNTASGTTVYYHANDGSSRALAACVMQAIGAVSGLPRRGARSDGMLYASGLAVLRTSAMPAILVEVAFINHARDRAKLVNAAFQQKIAQAIVKGVRNYIEGQPQEETPMKIEEPEPEPITSEEEIP
jgi:N-acetylmuramoyl-L-alanine amidase